MFDARTVVEVLTVRKARQLLRKHTPIHLERTSAFQEEAGNGRVGPTTASINLEDGLIRVATRQCCVHAVVEDVGEELLHADGWLEKDMTWDLLKANVRRSTPAREIAYALLSAQWKIPLYCEEHDPQKAVQSGRG